MPTDEPDLRAIPITSKPVALTAATILERMTGDECKVRPSEWNGFYYLSRQAPEGKKGRG
jgi:hypothetical protein